jgi:hypothetical protein
MYQSKKGRGVCAFPFFSPLLLFRRGGESQETMDELEDFDEELQEQIEDAKKALKALEKGNLVGRERATKVDFVHGRIKRCKVLIKSMNLELRDLSRMEQDPWKKVCCSQELIPPFVLFSPSPSFLALPFSAVFPGFSRARTTPIFLRLSL